MTLQEAQTLKPGDPLEPKDDIKTALHRLRDVRFHRLRMINNNQFIIDITHAEGTSGFYMYKFKSPKSPFQKTISKEYNI